MILQKSTNNTHIEFINEFNKISRNKSMQKNQLYFYKVAITIPKKKLREQFHLQQHPKNKFNKKKCKTYTPKTTKHSQKKLKKV